MSVPKGRQLASNRAARFHYEITETFSAGVALTGAEAKSVQTGSANLKGAFVLVSSTGQVWLKGCDIPPYRYAKGQPHERRRSRALLLTKREIVKLQRGLHETGMTAIPLELRVVGGKVKVVIAIGKGKKKWDKRETIRKRDTEREVRRTVKAGKL